MRNIINVSLPEEQRKEVERVVKEEKFATKSEFFRYLFRLWREEKLFHELEKERQDILQGRGKTLKSLKDLR
jgi:Arc/MetJ-type ribon-helix-helix transcriptional regulator